MSGKKTASDAGGFMDYTGAGTTGVEMLPSNATPEQMQKHFAKIFGSGNAPFFSTCATVTTKAPTVDWDNFSRNFTGPAIYVPAEKAVPTKYKKASYNFINSKVENAALGVKGNVAFNRTQETYEKGAKKTEFNIEDGNFAQANLGGDATYNNENSKVIAGSSDAAGEGSSSFIEISDSFHPFSPEEYLAKLLQTGVTSEELVSLLEKKYSIANLSYTLPSSSKKRKVLVNTLLEIADME